MMGKEEGEEGGGMEMKNLDVGGSKNSSSMDMKSGAIDEEKEKEGMRQ